MKKNVEILGIHDGHNAGASLIKNGFVVAAVQEEWLVNKKNHTYRTNVLMD
jgi:predicted NodU family carbamoyl transferase